jgi:hypothetical protein
VTSTTGSERVPRELVPVAFTSLVSVLPNNLPTTAEVRAAWQAARA